MSSADSIAGNINRCPLCVSMPYLGKNLLGRLLLNLIVALDVSFGLRYLFDTVF